MVLSSHCLCVSGQWSECGEGGSPTGRQHDPTRWQQPHGQGCHGNPQPRPGGGFEEEKWESISCPLGCYCRWMLVVLDPCPWSAWRVCLSLSPPPVPQQSKRLSTPAIALRSKSMTSELEEMGKTSALNQLLGDEKRRITRWKDRQGDVDKSGQRLKAEDTGRNRLRWRGVTETVWNQSVGSCYRCRKCEGVVERGLNLDS